MKILPLFLGCFVAILLLSCLEDRVAGTEVGNPEIILARVVLSDMGDSVEVDAMNLKMMGAHFVTESGDSGRLWDADTGTLFNLFDPGIVPQISSMEMERQPWSACELSLALPKGQGSMEDTLFPSGFSGANWARWTIEGPTQKRRYFFYLPDDFRFRLVFGKEAMRPWHAADTLYVTLNFNVTALAQALPPGDWITHWDEKGGEYMVLSPMENAAAHAAMLAEFPACFKADAFSSGSHVNQVRFFQGRSTIEQSQIGNAK
jgi:hypothetical protein